MINNVQLSHAPIGVSVPDPHPNPLPRDIITPWIGNARRHPHNHQQNLQPTEEPTTHHPYYPNGVP